MKVNVFLKGIISAMIFFVSSQLFTLLIIFPSLSSQVKSSTTFTRLLCWYANFVNKILFNIRFHHINLSKDTFANTSLLICNHQHFLDVPISMAFTPKACVINNNWHNNLGAKIFITKYLRVFPAKMPTDKLIAALKPYTAICCPILIFPEGEMYKEKIGRFRKGGFYLAKQLQIEIQPVVIYYSKNIFSKRWFFFQEGDVYIHYLPPIIPGSVDYGNTYQELTKNANQLMRKEYANMQYRYGIKNK